jgi:hypothetical protein
MAEQVFEPVEHRVERGEHVGFQHAQRRQSDLGQLGLQRPQIGWRTAM